MFNDILTNIHKGLIDSTRMEMFINIYYVRIFGSNETTTL